MLIFLAIGFSGVLMLVVSAVFSGDGDAGDHEVQGAEGATDSDHGIPRLFSLRALALFLTAFGASGAIATHYGLSPMVSSILGVVFGIALACVGVKIMGEVSKQQASSIVSSSDVIGATASVNIAIPEDGVGEITVDVRGQRKTYMARSASGEKISANTPVTVVDVVGTVCSVK